MTCRVLVVDDQELVREGLVRILASEDDIEVVAHAADGEQAVRETERHRPDVVLMDIRMPVLDGLSATRQVLARHAQTRVVILTTFDLDEYVYEALRAGASGFLLKDSPAEEIVRAVRVVMAGDALIAPSITRRLVSEFTRRLPPRDCSKVAALTGRERAVLIEMARGRNNREIGEDLYIAEGTVRTHVTHVLSKLHVRDRVQAVVIAYETGLVQPGHASES